MLIKAIFALMIAHAVVVGVESVIDIDIQGKKSEPEVRTTSIIG